MYSCAAHENYEPKSDLSEEAGSEFSGHVHSANSPPCRKGAPVSNQFFRVFITFIVFTTFITHSSQAHADPRRNPIEILLQFRKPPTRNFKALLNLVASSAVSDLQRRQTPRSARAAAPCQWSAPTSATPAPRPSTSSKSSPQLPPSSLSPLLWRSLS